MSLPATQFKISKKLMSDYIATPLSPESQPYIIDIANHGSTDAPYILMHEGTKTKDTTTVVGSVRRVPEEPAYEIKCTGLQNIEKANEVTMLRRSGSRSADVEFGASRGKPRSLTWSHAGRVGGSSKLLDATAPDTVLAEFQHSKVPTRGGTLSLNVDWGLDFERMAIISSIALCEKMSVWGKLYAVRQADVPLNGAGYAGQVSTSTGVSGGAGMMVVGGFAAGGGGCDGGGGGGGGGC